MHKEPSQRKTVAASAPVGLSGISSMATRDLLAELSRAYSHAAGPAVSFTSVGGVDAIRRVQTGEPFDLIVLASDAMQTLVEQGHVLAHSVRPLVRSSMVVAVPQHLDPVPDISSVPALQAALRRARRIAYSTGPSGQALLRLLQQWALQDELGERLWQSPAGVPVARWLAAGEADLGFQQRSELQGYPGVRVLGAMPPGAEHVTVFAAAVGASCDLPDQALAFLDFLGQPQHEPSKRRFGFEPV